MLPVFTIMINLGITADLRLVDAVLAESREWGRLPVHSISESCVDFAKSESCGTLVVRPYSMHDRDDFQLVPRFHATLR